MSDNARRGSQAIEFAATLPFLLVVTATVLDLSQYLTIRDALVGAVSAGARTGAMVGVSSGKDPMVEAVASAELAWHVANVQGSPAWNVVYEGTSPDRMLTLEGTVVIAPWFGLTPVIPRTVVYDLTIRTVIQP